MPGTPDGEPYAVAIAAIHGRPRSRYRNLRQSQPTTRTSVGRVSSYKVSVGNSTVRVKTFREVGPVVMEALTNLLAQDPEGAAEGTMMANRAFSVGTVEHALDTYGSWRTSVTVHGEPVTLVVVKKRLW
jgi:hypothetical protein